MLLHTKYYSKKCATVRIIDFDSFYCGFCKMLIRIETKSEAVVSNIRHDLDASKWYREISMMRVFRI